MRLDFVKMHGLGNDFIVCETPRGLVVEADRLKTLAQRHTGIGFDQALLLEPPRREGTEVYYRIFNADGSEVEQSGNGARCVAAYVAHRLGRVSGELMMDSPAGLVRARIDTQGQVSVAMATPAFEPAAIPFDATDECPEYTLRLAHGHIALSVVSIGNPHAVIRVASVDSAPVDTYGPEVENHPRFPRRTNVEFVEVVDRSHIRLRVFERGVGETQACGTGACAAVAVGRRRGWLDDAVDVDVPGGRLRVEWRGPDEPIWLSGPTATVFEGHTDL
jgi:diaminopimelate epimerase